MVFKRLLSVGLAFFFDFVVFFKAGGGSAAAGSEALFFRARHGIEKAFSLPSLKRYFGAEKAELLVYHTKIQLNKSGYDWQVADSHEILERYVKHLRDNGSSIPPEITEFIAELESSRPLSNTTHFPSNVQFEPPKTDLSFEDFARFFNSRYSVRDFDDVCVPEEIVREILQVAGKSPSACNRQAWEVKVFQGESAKRALSYQNGNSGFGHTISNVMLITGDLRAFVTRERNQAYIDGGLYSMSVMLAMHAHGLSSCPLNMCYSWVDRKRVFEGLGLQGYQVPIMMIAFGWKNSSTKVIRAQRKEVTELVTFVK